MLVGDGEKYENYQNVNLNHMKNNVTRRYIHQEDKISDIMVILLLQILQFLLLRTVM